MGVYIGKPNAMQEARINEVEVYRNGGSTKILYTLNNQEGKLYFSQRLDGIGKSYDEYKGRFVELELLVVEENL